MGEQQLTGLRLTPASQGPQNRLLTSLTGQSAVDNYSFYKTIVEPIPGWLHRGAAIRTMDMLEFQERSGLKGSLLEIGVYCGKYLSILIRHAGTSQSIVLGVDTFQLISVERVIEHLHPATSSAGTPAKLLQAFSTNCQAGDLLVHLTQRARFISVDGSHERDDVHWDLELAEKIAAPGSIVAVDDFINPHTLGVNEAVHIFFARPRRFVPWAYVENKLFLSDRQWAPRFSQMLEQKVLSDDNEPHSHKPAGPRLILREGDPGIWKILFTNERVCDPGAALLRVWDVLASSGFRGYHKQPQAFVVDDEVQLAAVEPRAMEESG
jgi:hypothetical protein